MSDSTAQNTTPFILPFQKSIFKRLCAYGRASLYVDRKSISTLKLRANFMLLGPTGTGKTHLAQAVARELNVPFLAVSVSDWIILGGSNRGSSVTWPNIVKFVQRSKGKTGAIIFIDELDKCHHDSNWNSFLRSEIFSLIDARVPLGIQDSDDDDLPESSAREVESFLAYKTMIIGGAAFQDIWEEQSAPRMGFNVDSSVVDATELSDLARYLPRELVNRFSSEIFVLPRLVRTDYELMIETFSKTLSNTWRERFLQLGHANLDQAVRHQKGVRYAEEILMAAIVAERGCMENFVSDHVREEVTAANPADEDASIFVF